MQRVLVVDDTAFMRQYLKKIIESSIPDCEVFVASNGSLALEKIRIYNPDVITLDFEMPDMNGIECLKEIVKIKKTPVIMVSSFTSEGTKVTIESLSLGAFDFICKPANADVAVRKEFETAFIEKVQTALKLTKKEDIQTNVNNASKPKPEINVKRVENSKLDYSKVDIIAIGISTGGPSVVRNILASLPKNFKYPIMVVQHMPVGFTGEFAQRLNEVCQIEVKEAKDGDLIKPGRALIAQGGKHLSVKREPHGVIARVYEGDKVSGHMPSADVLFGSVAREYKDHALGIIMTGMGADGSKGLLELKNSGSPTWGQSEDTCVVYGMPKAAAEIGAVCEVLSIEQIINKLKSLN